MVVGRQLAGQGSAQKKVDGGGVCGLKGAWSHVVQYTSQSD